MTIIKGTGFYILVQKDLLRFNQFCATPPTNSTYVMTHRTALRRPPKKPPTKLALNPYTAL